MACCPVRRQRTSSPDAPFNGRTPGYLQAPGARHLPLDGQWSGLRRGSGRVGNGEVHLFQGDHLPGGEVDVVENGVPAAPFDGDAAVQLVAAVVDPEPGGGAGGDHLSGHRGVAQGHLAAGGVGELHLESHSSSMIYLPQTYPGCNFSVLLWPSFSSPSTDPLQRLKPTRLGCLSISFV